MIIIEKIIIWSDDVCDDNDNPVHIYVCFHKFVNYYDHVFDKSTNKHIILLYSCILKYEY